MTKYVDLIQNQLKESAAVKTSMADLCSGDIERAGLLCAGVLGKGGKLLLCGNGGSAADAQHIATELVVRLSSQLNRKALPALALSVNSSTLTACANDYGFEKVFSRQVEAFGQSGDLLVGLSTSGNSANVIQALETANNLDLHSICFLGGNGGTLADMGEVTITIPHSDTGRIQEGHITAGHIMCEIIERELFRVGGEM